MVQGQLAMRIQEVEHQRVQLEPRSRGRYAVLSDSPIPVLNRMSPGLIGAHRLAGGYEVGSSFRFGMVLPNRWLSSILRTNG